MNSTPMGSGDDPDEDTPRRDVSAPSGDVLEDVLGRFAELEAAPAARALIAQVLAATLMAFTRTASVRDSLPDTAPESAAEALAVLGGIDHLRGALAAVDATWQVAAEERIRRDDAAHGVPSSAQGRGAGQEIALARRVSPAAASFSRAKARRLVQHMPASVDHLWSGGMTDSQASALSGALDGASPETCRRIDDHLREHPEFLHGKGHRRLQAEIRAMVQKLEPETSRERAERAARSRHVRMAPLADGMARISAVMRAVDAVGVMQSLRTRAESLRAAGERTPVPALEADLLVDDALRAAPATQQAPARHRADPAGSEPGSADAPDAASESESESESEDAATGAAIVEPPRLRPGLDVGIVITDTALLGRDDDAQTAELEGYGTIPAHILRDTLLGRPPGQLRDVEEPHPDETVTAFYRRLYRSPRTSELIGMESRARAFPAGLARMIRWRDTTCRAPWCNARIRHSDHAVPHHRGGATSYANGQGLCARCNLLKEHGLWVLTPHERRTTSVSDPDAPSGAKPDAQSDAPLDDRPGAGSGTRPRSDPSAPPRAWIWASPHGAHGTSSTPPLITPWPDPPPEGPTETQPGDRPAGSDDEPPEEPPDEPPEAPPSR
ncbi:HNH endonuclease [Brachybacterium saurashtrense]|uniref:HNH endonuclease n=1 Tax=Brachybacterium saurashtrense TaxID=556288 RepID=A0A345YKC8_9MICO|nr:HNH endonuclease [Brachybacterium saurashtrense]AXK44380.1 HNH endonuclease [Brachybacterium saurashtrense]RRR22991.1 HNH endonuclease [Brachybacterium saurashtrense]